MERIWERVGRASRADEIIISPAAVDDLGRGETGQGLLALLLAVLDCALHLALRLLMLGRSLLCGSDALLRVWELLPFDHWH